jgi:hypothetical protein
MDFLDTPRNASTYTKYCGVQLRAYKCTGPAKLNSVLRASSKLKSAELNSVLRASSLSSLGLPIRQGRGCTQHIQGKEARAACLPYQCKSTQHDACLRHRPLACGLQVFCTPARHHNMMGYLGSRGEDRSNTFVLFSQLQHFGSRGNPFSHLLLRVGNLFDRLALAKPVAHFPARQPFLRKPARQAGGLL